MSGGLKINHKSARISPGGRALPSEGTANTKAQRGIGVWCVCRTEGRSRVSEDGRTDFETRMEGHSGSKKVG